MPKTYTLKRITDTPEIMEGWALPMLGELLALPFDASGSGKIGGQVGGMELRIESGFKLVDGQPGFDGAAQTMDVTVIVRRKAVNENEQNRIDKAVAEQGKRSLASKLRKAEESTQNVQATIGAFREGQIAQAQIVAAHSKPKSTADVVRDMADTLQAAEALRGIIGGKLLTDGK